MRLVIFDCDGTLVDGQHMIVAAMHEAYRFHSLNVPAREELLSIVGLSLPEAFLALGRNAADYPIAGLVDRYKQAFFELRQKETYVEPLFPGAREVIDGLARRSDVILGIATGKSRRGVDAVLGQHELLDRFAIIKTSDDAPSKPHPAMVLDAINEVGVTAADTVVVGDTSYDMVMAQAAGASGIGVAWGYHPPHALNDAGAYAVIEQFSDLLPVLDRMWV
jgi:phosphoglycolate phosphatase